MYTEGRFNNHTAHSLYRIMDMETSVMCVMKMGNIVPRVGPEQTSLAFWASVLPLHHICSLMSPQFPHPPAVGLCSSSPQWSVQTTTTALHFERQKNLCRFESTCSTWIVVHLLSACYCLKGVS